MLVRMIEFGAAHREWFPEGSLAGKSFATVAKAVATLKDLAVAQLARMEGARARRDARAALVETLQRISRTTRVIQADDLTFPITCRLPAGESAQAVLTAARLFARGLEAVAASFIAYGMDDTFVADLTSRLENYEQALHPHDANRRESAATRATLDWTIAEAMTAARRLDVIGANRLYGDPAAIAEWACARRLSYTRRVTKAASANATTPVASARPVAGPKPVAAPPVLALTTTRRVPTVEAA
jgi:hypothetical protein